MIRWWSETRGSVSVAVGSLILWLTVPGCHAGTARLQVPPSMVPTALERTHAPEPGADALLESMEESVRAPRVGADGITRVGVSRIRNQSHASTREFVSLCRRLAGHLSEAGRASRWRFTSDPQEAVDYELRGAAYLLTADGFDQWEVYLSLHPAGEGWPLWRADRPIRMLRQPRSGQREIVAW